MKLNVYERLVLLNILPKEGDFTTLRIVRELRESLSLSEEEHTRLNVQRGWQCGICKAEVVAPMPADCPNDGSKMRPTGQLLWDDDKDIEIDIAMGAKAKEAVVTALKTLNDDKKLSEQHLSLYEKFVERGE